MTLRCHDLCATSSPGPTPLFKMAGVIKEKAQETKLDFCDLGKLTIAVQNDAGLCFISVEDVFQV